MSFNKAASAAFIRKHGVKQSDIDLADRLTALIESRPDNLPQVGDIVICTNPNGKVFYGGGHLENTIENWRKDRYKEPKGSVCTQPSTPFVFASEDGKISTDTSGGYWFGYYDNSELTPDGKRIKLFEAFGHCGACEAGAFSFEATVNVWKYENEKIY